jgi:hypothetical protein
MDEIINGRKAFKEAWAALPRDRKRAVSKAVQAGHEVREETAIAAGYAQRQISTSWLGYLGIIGLAFVINIVQGEEIAGNSLTWAILAAIVAIGIYSYWRLFQARANNLALLEQRGADATPDGDAAEIPVEEEISRLQAEGGPVTEVPEPQPNTPPEPATPSAHDDERPTGE